MEWLAPSCGEIVAYSGQNYNTILIGSQCWFKENLNVGIKLNQIPVGTDQTNNAIIEKYCSGDNVNNCNLSNNGGLYQWGEAMGYITTEGAQGICPSGWHIPTHDELTSLERAVCTSGTCATDFPYDTITTGVWRGATEGDKLKQTGLCNGRTPCGTSGFDNILTGLSVESTPLSPYQGGGLDGYFWSSSQSGANAWFRLGSRFTSGGAYRGTFTKLNGLSVRCLKN